MTNQPQKPSETPSLDELAQTLAAVTAERDAAVQSLAAARWDLLEQRSAHPVSATALRRLGHDVSEFVTEDGDLDHVAYRAAAQQASNELGINSGGHAPHEGRHIETPPSAAQQLAHSLFAPDA